MGRFHEGEPTVLRRDVLTWVAAFGVRSVTPVSFLEQGFLGFIDKYTGDFKRFRKEGERVIDYFSGFMSDDREFRLNASLSMRQFVAIRTRLAEKGWGMSESFFFTYGKEGMDLYSPKDTARDPERTKQKAIEYAEYQVDMQPKVKRIGIAHSAGFIPLLEILSQFPNRYDLVIFLSSPLYGLEPSIPRKLKAGVVHQVLRQAIGMEEHLSQYLFNLWKDKDYRKNLDTFFDKFVEDGNEVYCFTTENDTIVPKESALLKSALVEAGGNKIRQVLPIVWSLYPQDAHGAVFIDKETLETIAEIVGENKAA